MKKRIFLILFCSLAPLYGAAALLPTPQSSDGSQTALVQKLLAAHNDAQQLGELTADIAQKYGPQGDKENERHNFITQLSLALQSARTQENGAAIEAVTQHLNQLFPAPPAPGTFGKAFNRARNYLGLTGYHAADRIMKTLAEEARTQALLADNPSELYEGYNKNMMGEVEGFGAAVRHAVGATSGLIPLVDHLPVTGSDESSNEAAMHSHLSKGLGIGHLAARGLNLGTHLATRGSYHLTPVQARALAYHNRRHGAPQELIDMYNRTKAIERSRVALNVLGNGILPAVFNNAYLPRDEQEPGSYTSHGLGLTNVTGIIDSLLGIYRRIRDIRAWRALKRQLPAMIKELQEKPPTPAEQVHNGMMEDGNMGMMDGMAGMMMPGMNMGLAPRL